MIKHFLSFLMLFMVLTSGVSYAQIQRTESLKTAEEILAEYHNEKPTNCSTKIFSEALLNNADSIDEMSEEFEVSAWAKHTMLDADVLEQILKCPEITSISDETTIIFDPIVYKFPNGRQITVNYNTQPKVLKQHLLLASKRSLPNGNISPKLMDPNDPAKYINTEPSWYGILVVQHDSLSEFVGPGKNNTVSLKYINDNIDKIYPRGYFCTSKSAWANDNDTINQVVKKVVDIEDDTNDYYVAGDVNLEWVMYAEVAADVIITVLTLGGGALAHGVIQSARSTKILKNLKNSLKFLRKDENVIKYINLTNKIKNNEKAIKTIEESGKTLRDLRKQYQRALSAGKIEESEEILRKIANISNEMKKLNVTGGASIVSNLTTEAKTAEKIAKITKETEQLAKEADALSRAHKSINLYKDSVREFENMMNYRRALKGFSRPQTGNIIVRNLKKMNNLRKTIKAVNNGTKAMNKASKVARAGMSTRSAKMKFWLFDTTLKNGGRLAKIERKIGALYGVVVITELLAGLYDGTSDTSKEFSNGIEFKPLGLLSADDLKGQENVINYGMWLMWVGNSTDPADDDAAYLQAMDFAAKFFYELDEFQDDHIANCNVDIYVVSPIIRLDETNVDNPKGEMFYLFMNEIPWSTNEKFQEKIGDINEWERAQKDMEEKDPMNKSKKKEDKQPENQTTE